MAKTSAMLHVRIDEELKAEAIRALDSMGLSTSDAVRILLRRIVADQAFPLELKVPKGRPREASAEGVCFRSGSPASFAGDGLSAQPFGPELLPSP